jgi:hypothetical protein
VSINEYDSEFIAQVSAASKRKLAQQQTPPDETDPTRDIRKKQANLCDAVMMRVVEMETAAAALLEAAKKLRAAVVANT